MKKWRLTSKKVRRKVNPQKLGLSSTKDLRLDISSSQKIIMAQERALSSLKFGLSLKDLDFNIYVAGASSLGANFISKNLVKEQAQRMPCPSDWCYVYNFKAPDSPQALEFPPGKGKIFRKDIEELIELLKQKIPEVLEEESFLNQKENLIREFNATRAQIFEELERKVRAEGFVLNVEAMGMMIIPAKEDGSPMKPEEVRELPEDRKEELKQKSAELQKELNLTARRVQQMERELKEKIKAMEQKTVQRVISFAIQELKEKYTNNKVQNYLEDLERDILEHVEDFKPQSSPPPPLPLPMAPSRPKFQRYKVNLFIDHTYTQGAPVIFEANPTYTNLFGTIERKAQFGTLFTDFTMLKPGSLHKANGGFLILRAWDLLRSPFSWEALKRTIKTRKINLEDLGEQLGLFTTKSLKPEPIPFKGKIIMIGDPFIYHLLYFYDEIFKEIFKVKAHLDIWVDFNEERCQQFLKTIAYIVETEKLFPVDATGLARLIELSCELAGRQDKLSLKIPEIRDILKEAHFWAQKQGENIISKSHIKKAIKEKRYRASLLEDHIQEMIQKDLLKIYTEGKLVGTINGLTFYDLGDHTFGRPTRITANISLGKEGVINIEREAELSGKIHTKGMMILSGFLKERFAHNKPLALSATICFEQTYGLVEGDSASSAELLALLSAIAEIPIDQSIAITGSISQKGEMQPVGGVTKKIEGFFAVCKAKGLTGKQGVIIPKANIKDLMLQEEVVEAIEEEKFHIWAVDTIEEAVEIIMGIPAGKRKRDGTYPSGTLFYLVDKRLEEMTYRVKEFLK